MLIVLHVLIAISSIVFAGYTFLLPSSKKLQVSYGLTALTLLSGTYLVLSTHAAMLQACMTGLIYLAIVLAETFAARTRLAKVTNR